MKPKKYLKNILILSLLLFIGGCATTTLSPMQKRHITTKMIEGSYENVYRATLTVLQDQGYIIKNTDMDSGLIVANADRKTSGGSRFMQALFAGYVYDKGSEIEITCMTNKLSDQTSEIRMNIREVKYGQSSASGISGKQDVEQIYDENIYHGLFNEITVEVKRREALNR
jgi:hypothetical protein